MTTTKGQRQSSYKAHRLRQIAYGRWEPYVDAQPVREHVAALMAHGITYDGVGRLAGVSRGAVQQLMEGARGRQPSTRLLRKTADALRSVRFDLDALPDTFMISGAGTRRRIQGLAVLGYTLSYQARCLGRAVQEVHDLASTPRVTAAMARRVRDLYAELCMRPATDVPRSSYARVSAQVKGWVPPLAWDDDLIDLTDEALNAELRRRAAAMDDDELLCCENARRLGDPSPLMVAGSREYRRRRSARQRSAA